MKKLAIIFVLVVAIFVLASCDANISGNRVMYGKDVQTFTYAYIRLGDAPIKEGYIIQWRDYEDSDVVQVMIDGKYYLTHYTNVVMVADPSHGNLDYSNSGTYGVTE